MILSGNPKILATWGAEEAPVLTGNSGVNWTLSNTTGYVQPFAGTIDKTGDGTGTITPTAATTIVAGTLYKVEIVVSAISVSTMTYTLGGVTGRTLSSATTYIDYIIATTTGKLILTPTATTLRVTISSISFKALASNSGQLSLRSLITNKIIVPSDVQNALGIFRASGTQDLFYDPLNGAIGIGALPSTGNKFYISGNETVTGTISAGAVSTTNLLVSTNGYQVLGNTRTTSGHTSGVQLQSRAIVSYQLDNVSLTDNNEGAEAAGTYFDLTSGKSGRGSLVFGDGVGYADFIFTTAGVVTLFNTSGNVFTSLQTGTNHVIIKDNGSNVRIVNELGSTTTFTLTVNYTN